MNGGDIRGGDILRWRHSEVATFRLATFFRGEGEEGVRPVVESVARRHLKTGGDI